MLKILSLLLLTACAQTKYTSIREELNNENISMRSILDLSRASYLKGCTDSSKKFSTLAPNHFDECVGMAIEHQITIEEILYKETKKSPE